MLYTGLCCSLLEIEDETQLANHPLRGGAVPIEIKAGATYNKSFLKGINYWKKIQPQTPESFLIYTGETSFQQQETKIFNWKELDKIA